MVYNIIKGDTMKKDLPNVLIDNALTQEDVAEIYKIVSSTTSQTFVEDLGYNSWHIQLPQHIIDKFTKYAEGIAGESLVLKEYNFSRYQKTVSNCGKYTFYPLLFPHTDEVFNESRLTLDYQIGSNVSWGITVDNWESEATYTLKDNQLLSFSGSHQVHWRPKREFVDGEFLEAIFLHFSPTTSETLTADHVNIMRERAKEKYIVWNDETGASSNKSEDGLLKYNPKESN